MLGVLLLLYIYFIWLGKRHLPDYVTITEDRIRHEPRISVCFLLKVSLVSNTHIKYHVKFLGESESKVEGHLHTIS